MAHVHRQSQNFSHIAGGNTATPYFRFQLPHELEFAAGTMNGAEAEKKMPLAVHERPLLIVCSYEPHRSRFSELA
jgi:hypothetical protein